MIVLKKEPGKDPMLTDIDNTLESFQKNVGGYIETVTLTEELVIVCNEEGRIQSLPYICTLLRAVDFYGTILVVGMQGEDYTDASVITAGYFQNVMSVEEQ